MALLILETSIKAPLIVVFDLSRSIDLHMLSTTDTHEKAIAGVTSGLIKLHETVKWKAKHLGIYQTLTVRITQMKEPYFFEDKMIQGIFEFMEHQHIFEEINDEVVMKDIFQFRAPWGILGRLAEWMFLKRYMKRFLEERNTVIKEVAESGKWRNFLSYPF
ncbi:SRPBCC family protein [Sphingobacterium sp. SRCM116780]|uniref:SRPBCC family protein n=1 Tax=Sphingobacterium sp. SRCM116780 TaxID=2907623 RepID=UPI001F3E6740|nr:SRPBCC family protein [Sphingobacterium sp. SRCM116780]UIR57264.1 SRPBCC family protein [Sphingobacterium sp. SRCM116780]